MDTASGFTKLIEPSINKPCSNSSSPIPPPVKNVKVLRGLLMLNEGITAKNFYSSWLQLSIIAAIWLSVDTLQALLLKERFQINQESVGMTVAQLQMIDYVFKILVAMIYGPLIDYAGRKIMYYYGITSVVLGYLLIPMQYSIYPGYLLCKLLISNGGMVIQMLPLLADYVHVTTKGTAAGLNYTLAFFGAFIAAGFLYLFSALKLPVSANYIGLGIFIGMFGTIIGLGMLGGNKYYKNNGQTPLETENFSLKNQLKKVYHSFKTIPWLLISMICSVLGNSDYYVLTTGLVFYVQSFIPISQNVPSDSDNNTNYNNAVNKKVGETQVIFFVICVFVSAFYGRIMDKVAHLRLLLPLMIIASIGFYLIPFIQNIFGFLFYLFICIEAISLPGTFVFATYLGVVYSPPDQRGTIGGIITSTGLIAAMFVIVVGGILHDKINLPDASFLLFCGILTISTILVFVIYFKKIRNKVNTININDSNPSIPLEAHTA